MQAFPSLQVAPFAFTEQVPSEPAKLHAWHWSAQAVLQQTPLAQKPEGHWLLEVQESPNDAS